MIKSPLPSGLYAILDAETCGRRGLAVRAVAEAWCAAGVRLLQYRDKRGSDAAVLENAAAIQSIFEGTGARLLLNDRVHLVAASGWHGVHVGQTDLSIGQARAMLGPDAILGVSTHTPEQVRAANLQPCDYIAVGPVFGTTTKLDAEPAIGLDGVREARALTRRPLVAIGGIGLQQAQQVRASGADCVALISALLPAYVDGANGLKRAAQDFLLALQ